MAGLMYKISANETKNSFSFQMNDCRVQFAPKRQGLSVLPCKSGGLVENSEFAKTINPHITTTCIACLPDKYSCVWHFYIDGN